MTQRQTLWTRVAIGVATLIALLAVAFAGFNWGLLKDSAARRLSASIGRTVTIARAERLDTFSLTPHLRLSGIRVGQPAWAGKGDMATIRTIEMRLPVWPLLAGRFRPRNVVIAGLRANLIHLPDGRANWKMGKPGKGGPVRTALTLRDATIQLDERRRRIVMTVSVVSDAKGLRVSGQGTQRGAPIALTLTGAPLDGRDTESPYPFHAHIASPLSTMDLDGKMEGAFNTAHFRAQASAHGQNLEYLDDVVLAGLPGTQDFKVAGMIRHDNPDWIIERMSGTIGRSTFAGPLTVKKRDGRTILDGDIHSTQFDFDDLASNAGKARAAARRAITGPRVAPFFAIHLEHMRKTDGRLGYTIDKLLLPAGAPFQTAHGTFRLDHSVLTAAPLTIGLTHGAITGRASVDHRGKAPAFAVDVSIKGARMGDLTGPKANIDAPLRGHIRLSGHGQTIRDAVATSDGTVAFVAEAGRIKTATAQFLGQDAGRGVLAGSDDTTALRCAIIRFDGKRGVYTANPVVIDTGVSRADISGTIAMATDRLDIHITGRAKQPRLLRLPAPVEVKGLLSKPNIGLATEEVKGGLIGKIGRILGVGAKQPPVADADCAGLAKRALG